MNRRIVLLGGGHSHVEILRRLAEARDPVLDGAAVSLVSPEPNHFYSGMGPGMLGGRYRPRELVLPVAALCARAGVRFIRGTAARIDSRDRVVELHDGGAVPFDVLSCNVGSRVDCGDLECGPSVLPVKPIRNLRLAVYRIEQALERKPLRLAVVGGGPAAFEIAGNLSRMLRILSDRLPDPVAARAAASSVELIPGRRPLRPFSPRVLRLARRELRKAGVEITGNTYARRTAEDRIVCDNGTIVRADLTLLATGVRVPRFIADSGFPVGSAGEMVVDRNLQSVGCRGVFGVGDCIALPSRRPAKVGVYAVRQTPVLLANLSRYLVGKELRRFEKTGRYLLLFNLGTPKGVLVRGRLSVASCAALVLKDRIDRSFARRFTGAVDRLADSAGTHYTTRHNRS
jgi:NADH dehydrogenase FAD-containing subunit